MSRPKVERNEDIYNRRLQGWSYGRLARVYGISRPRVYAICKAEEKRRKKC